MATVTSIAGEAAAQGYYDGVRSAKFDQLHQHVLVFWNSPGLNLSWNLPPSSQIRSVEMVGALVLEDSKDTVGGPELPATGTLTNATTDTTWPTPVALPYTYTQSYTPLYSGAGTSSYSFDCVGGVGTNFRISNAPAFGFAPVGGVWYDPNQSGSGYGLDYQNGILLVQVYSYLERAGAVVSRLRDHDWQLRPRSARQICWWPVHFLRVAGVHVCRRRRNNDHHLHVANHGRRHPPRRTPDQDSAVPRAVGALWRLARLPLLQT